jgi:flagellar biosynthetic protein FliS
MHPILSNHNADRRAAFAGYRTVSLEARIAGADAHGLVQMLYERLCQLLREASTAEATEAVRRLRATERALAIVDSLDSSLDRTQGGKVAVAMGDVYALIRDRLLSRANMDDAIAAADMLRETWRTVGAGRQPQKRSL